MIIISRNEVKMKKSDNKFWQFLNEYVNKKYLTVLNSHDGLITHNLREAHIETREAGNNGLWCCMILPAVLMIYNLLYNVSQTYTIVAYTSLGLMLYCFLFIAFLSVSCLVLQEQVYGGCIASSLISALLLYAFVVDDLTTSLVITIPTIFLFSTILRMSLMRFPKTFTVGEAMLVSQSIVLFIVMTAARQFEDDDDEFDLITAVVNTALTSVGIIVTALVVMTPEQRNLLYLRNVVLGAALFGVLMLHSLQGLNCFPKTLQYVFGTAQRIELFTFWLGVSIIAVVALSMRTQLAVKASTVTRKSFHLLASAVFMSGIVCDQQLMVLASGVGLAVLILVEALRKSDIDPISSSLQSAFLVYSDEKDSGTFAMTPLYLYCGLACPLVLVPRHGGERLELLAGVLATGVGDTAASWFGSRYGINKLTDSNKTFEGTIFNVLCQITTVYALEIFGLMNANNALFRTAIAASISAVVEALTVQVDNLVLPIITLLAFQLSWPLS